MTLPAKVIILLQTTPNLPEKNASSPFKSTNPCLVMKKISRKTLEVSKKVVSLQRNLQWRIPHYANRTPGVDWI